MRSRPRSTPRASSARCASTWSTTSAPTCAPPSRARCTAASATSPAPTDRRRRGSGPAPSSPTRRRPASTAGSAASSCTSAWNGSWTTIADELGLDPRRAYGDATSSRPTFPYATPTGGVYDSGRLPAGARAGAGQRRATTRLRQAGGPRRRASTIGIGIATIVDPSGDQHRLRRTRRPRPSERTPGRGKSGSTEHVRVTWTCKGSGHGAARHGPAGPGPRHGRP